MSNEIDRDPELRALGELCRELVRRDVNVQIRDAVPALVVSTGMPGVPVYVVVAESGRFFGWYDADHQHPVSDPKGAAREIARFLADTPCPGQ